MQITSPVLKWFLIAGLFEGLLLFESVFSKQISQEHESVFESSTGNFTPLEFNTQLGNRRFQDSEAIEQSIEDLPMRGSDGNYTPDSVGLGMPLAERQNAWFHDRILQAVFVNSFNQSLFLASYKVVVVVLLNDNVERNRFTVLMPNVTAPAASLFSELTTALSGLKTAVDSLNLINNVNFDHLKRAIAT